MILRRVITHFRNQEWTAIALDFLIVVIGVFVGIQVSNWNEARGEREQAARFISRLADDFAEISERQQTSIQRIESFIDATEIVYEAVSSKSAPDDPEAFAAALRSVADSRVPAWRSVTFLEMQSSGDIDLIGDPSLKSALVAYDQSTLIAHEAFRILMDRSLAFSKPIYSAVRFQPNLAAADASSSYTLTEFDFDQMTSNPEFLPAISAHVTVHSNNRALQAVQLERARNVLQLLQNRKSTL